MTSIGEPVETIFGQYVVQVREGRLLVAEVYAETAEAAREEATLYARARGMAEALEDVHDAISRGKPLGPDSLVAQEVTLAIRGELFSELEKPAAISRYARPTTAQAVGTRLDVRS